MPLPPPSSIDFAVAYHWTKWPIDNPLLIRGLFDSNIIHVNQLQLRLSYLGKDRNKPGDDDDPNALTKLTSSDVEVKTVI